NPVDVGHTTYLGSGANGLTVSSNFAYLVTGFVLMYDVLNPARPVSVGSMTASPASASSVAISGNYAYVANGYDGLRIYLITPQLQISLTSTNTVLASWPLPPAPGFGLQQSFDLAATNWLDVTNSPVVVSNRNQVV